MGRKRNDRHCHIHRSGEAPGSEGHHRQTVAGMTVSSLRSPIYSLPKLKNRTWAKPQKLAVFLGFLRGMGGWVYLFPLVEGNNIPPTFRQKSAQNTNFRSMATAGAAQPKFVVVVCIGRLTLWPAMTNGRVPRTGPVGV